MTTNTAKIVFAMFININFRCFEEYRGYNHWNNKVLGFLQVLKNTVSTTIEIEKFFSTNSIQVLKNTVTTMIEIVKFWACDNPY